MEKKLDMSGNFGSLDKWEQCLMRGRKKVKEFLVVGGMESHVSRAHITEIKSQKTSPSQKRKMKTGI